MESDSTSLTISWERVPDATAYEIVYSPLNDPNVHHTTRVYTNHATLTDLDGGTAYEIQVSCHRLPALSSAPPRQISYIFLAQF